MVWVLKPVRLPFRHTRMAPAVGLEPTSLRLTAACATIAPHRNLAEGERSRTPIGFTLAGFQNQVPHLWLPFRMEERVGFEPTDAFTPTP